MSSLINNYKGKEIDLETITPLFQLEDYEVYWLGIDNETAFRCNVYLIKSGNEVILIDPGSREFFQRVKQRVEQIVPVGDVTALILCHQDPDVSASMIDWLDLNPKLDIYTSDRTNVLLPHYGRDDYNFISVDVNKTFQFKTGYELEFIPSPFLHFAGAFTTYDKQSQFIFSGDIWAALDINWELVVSDFTEHMDNMNLFHIDYMASNLAARGFVYSIQDKKIMAILPQHGSIIPQEYVPSALKYLEELRCGTDIIYGDLNNHG